MDRLLEVAPSDVTLYIMRTLCDSKCLFALGQSCHRLLTLSRHVDLPDTARTSKFQLGALIRDRWESDAFFDDMNENQQASILHAFAPGDLQPQSKRPKLKNCRPQPRATTRRYQIGRLTDVVIPSHFPRFNRLFFPRLHLLATVRSLTIKVAFGVDFQPVYPPNLTRLTFSGPIRGQLSALTFPSNDRLRELTFRMELREENLDHMKLPSSLHRFCISGNFTAPIKRITLPQGLQELEFNEAHFDIERLILPEGMTRLLLNSPFNHVSFSKLRLPSTVTELALPTLKQPAAMRCWIPPQSLTRLQISSLTPLRGVAINLPLATLTFELPLGWNNLTPPASINFHNYLTRVSFIQTQGRTDLYAHVIFPPSVTFVFIPRANNTKWNPPPALREIHVGSSYGRVDTALTLPNTVTRIQFDSSAYTDFHAFVWPSSLECLNFGDVTLISPTIYSASLPASLKRVELASMTPEWIDIQLPKDCFVYHHTREGYQLNRQRIEAIAKKNLPAGTGNAPLPGIGLIKRVLILLSMLRSLLEWYQRDSTSVTHTQ